MKNLVLFLFVFVVGVWVTEGQQSAEGPSEGTEEETDEPSDNEDGNSTTGKSLAAWTTNLKYTRYSTTCTRCCKGWTGVPGRCRDINECRRKPCPWNARCINTGGSYRCACDRGYTMGRRECNDVNECRRNPCGKYGKCRNTIGSYKCYCRRGFQWNGRTCIDINECRRGRVCGRYARCYNTPGSYYCKCYNSGYKKIGRKCVDINECKNNPCPSDAKCYNYPGSYRCACKRGYQFVNRKCVDYNECKYRGRCDHICLNTPGSFSCRCRKGFELYKKRYCVDINECRKFRFVFEGSYNTLHFRAQKLETPFSLDNAPLSPNSLRVGFLPVDFALSALSTCQTLLTELEPESLALRELSTKNPCCAGFVGSVDGCRDTDECYYDNGNCNQKCNNSMGTYNCYCDHGYQLINETYCDDINECDHMNGGCNHHCNNTIGGHKCECFHGYSLQNRTQCFANSCR
ncbi:fibulin-1-like isoform X1 [Octopus vulgaris]|uniref:Fibulin-1-like isoform X1 n=1 Tax=Octopus vulgaris TaxID=6645 RepID=A0AA36BW29_OCTVU|nr:fibulin-1-like isoform X1 [Octopus vulgaris]